LKVKVHLHNSNTNDLIDLFPILIKDLISHWLYSIITDCFLSHLMLRAPVKLLLGELLHGFISIFSLNFTNSFRHEFCEHIQVLSNCLVEFVGAEGSFDLGIGIIVGVNLLAHFVSSFGVVLEHEEENFEKLIRFMVNWVSRNSQEKFTNLNIFIIILVLTNFSSTRSTSCINYLV